MSLEDFLNASYALLAEEHQRIDPFKDFLSLTDEIAPEPAIRPLTVAARNDDSLNQLNQMMAGVKKGR